MCSGLWSLMHDRVNLASPVLSFKFSLMKDMSVQLFKVMCLQILSASATRFAFCNAAMEFKSLLLAFIVAALTMAPKVKKPEPDPPGGGPGQDPPIIGCNYRQQVVLEAHCHRVTLEGQCTKCMAPVIWNSYAAKKKAAEARIMLRWRMLFQCDNNGCGATTLHVVRTRRVKMSPHEDDSEA